jgi:hypothetical protein
MPIEFTLLHNLIRTYQRSLHLNESPKPSVLSPHAKPDDRVSISGEARDEHRHPDASGDGNDADAAASEYA